MRDLPRNLPPLPDPTLPAQSGCLASVTENENQEGVPSPPSMLQGHQAPLQGYPAHEKHPPPRTLQKDYTYGPMEVPGGGAVSYERGTPV